MAGYGRIWLDGRFGPVDKAPFKGAATFDSEAQYVYEEIPTGLGGAERGCHGGGAAGIASFLACPRSSASRK